MNIYEIKRRTAETSPHYFSRRTMQFFGQTLKSFSVRKQPDGRFEISAPIHGNPKNLSTRLFNPANDKLELI